MRNEELFQMRNAETGRSRPDGRAAFYAAVIFCLRKNSEKEICFFQAKNIIITKPYCEEKSNTTVFQPSPFGLRLRRDCKITKGE